MGLDDVASRLEERNSCFTRQSYCEENKLSASSTLAEEQVVKVSNTTGADIDLWIEPLGDRLLMPRGDTFEIMAANDLEHEVEIEFRQNAVVVHGWVKRINSISASGQRIRLWP